MKKKCCRCGQLLPVTKFGVENRALDGLRGHCVLCEGKYRRKYLKRNPWITAYRAAKSRCTNPKDKAYKYYGGKGIKFELTGWQIRFLWLKASARAMKRPSLDRIKNTKNYVMWNCQFIEHGENVTKSNHSRKGIKYKKG